jgi:uncharacterized protein
MLTDLVTQALSSHPEVELAIVFGSVAAGTAAAHSDVDLAVLAAAPLSADQKMALVADVAFATGRAVDLIDLRTAGEPLMGQILEHGQRLLGSPEAHARLVSRHLVDAEDFLPYARRILAERRRAWTGT